MEQMERLQGIIFEPDTIDMAAYNTYLDGLFSSDAGKAVLKSWTIRSVLSSDLMNQWKRATLKEIAASSIVLEELASVLTMRLDDLESWSWPADGILSLEYVGIKCDFEWFGPSLPHNSMLATLEYFGVSHSWLKFLKSFHRAPIHFPQDPTSVVRLLGEVVLFGIDFAVNQRANGLYLYRLHDEGVTPHIIELQRHLAATKPIFGWVNLFVKHMAVRDRELQENWDLGRTSKTFQQGAPDEFLPFKEYVQYRETLLEHWQELWLEMLRVPDPRNITLPPVLQALQTTHSNDYYTHYALACTAKSWCRCSEAWSLSTQT
ncbi:hypothetical protein PC9H_009861 [Pleurotus ostreatus]|uniref:Uncharacterized protein n=1 Tax=Pleurotus ostreatus TaxID=5322 RepID=A0A8H7DNC5_PLEOS|nr:uncharacterized protein PC9H_009861 [Pleurotus ostreatus]KAF7424554.1 hypothetical protein PC9H_009861 [Pleurotus ostreatus]